MFLLFPRFGGKLVLEEQAQIIIEQIEIPQTQQINRPPPPARPSIPIESESDDISEDLTMDELDLESFEAWDAPPPPPEGPQVKFIPYDDPPVPKKPIRPEYPEIAQEAGIEGTVYVQAFIDEKGRVKEVLSGKIIKQSKFIPNEDFFCMNSKNTSNSIYNWFLSNKNKSF